MNNINRILIVSILLLQISISINGQTKLHFIVSGGLSLPLGDFKLEVPTVDTVRADWPYQTKIGYHFGAAGILPLDKRENINLSFGISYTSLSNNIGVITPATSNGGNNFDNESQGGVSVTFMPRINLYTINCGILYVFSPKNKFHPMFSLEGAINFFSGHFDFDQTSTSIYSRADLKSSIRFGLLFGGGLEYRIDKNFGIFGGMKYSIANLVGKTAENSSLTSSIALGDKGHSENGMTRSTKNISYFQISLGVVLYLNKSAGDRK